MKVGEEVQQENFGQQEYRCGREGAEAKAPLKGGVALKGDEDAARR